MTMLDKDVPLPRDRVEYPAYPFSQMEVGDSFLVANADDDPNVVHRLHSQVSWQHQRHPEMRFTARRVTGGIRVWRKK